MHKQRGLSNTQTPPPYISIKKKNKQQKYCKQKPKKIIMGTYNHKFEIHYALVETERKVKGF